MEVLRLVASRAQRRLWFVEQVAPGEPVNNINFELRFGAPLDRRALRLAVADLLERHESLRTALVFADGVLEQVVLDRPDVPVREVDLTGAADPDAAAARLRDEVAGEPFTLAEAPLLRITHLRRAGGDTLLWSVHHAVADAWSVGILVRDFATAYGARDRGAEPDLPALPIQYADVTAWQEQRATEPAAQADLAYWRDQLADLPTVDLTLGEPRPEAVSHRGGEIPVSMTAEQGRRIDELARAERVTPFMVLLAAYATAVSKVFGGTDVPVSATVAGRPLSEMDGVVGLFADRLVLRLDLAGRPTFRELLHRAREVLLAAQEHAGVTFDQIVEALAPDRRLGTTPLAQVAINLQPTPPSVSVADLPPSTGGEQYGNGTVQHDLGLDVTGQHGRYAGALTYRHGVVSAGAAHRVARVYAELLAAGTDDPDRPVWRVPALSGAELPYRGDDGGAVDGPFVPVTARVAEHAAATPDAVALLDGRHRIGYSELAARTHALAGELRRRGVRAEVPVLLAVPRSVELVTGLLAVLAAGGAYVPVDPAAPAGHLAELAARTGARLALVRPGDGPDLPAGVVRLPVRLDGPVPADPGPPPGEIRPGQAAYVLFTSGSTGTPKGVVVSHGNLAAYLRGQLAVLGAPAGGSWLMLQAPVFDASGTVLHGSLTTGGTLHLVDQDTATDPRLLAGWLREHPVDYYKITPSHLAALLRGTDPAELAPRRGLVLGGEASTVDFVGTLRRAGWPVHASYGPTETTINVLAGWLDDAAPGAPDGERAGTPLGPPLPGVRAYILDDDGQPVPPGRSGELYLAGDLVSRGYLAAPAATAEAFLPDPFGPAPGGRMYRTGDLVRRRPDGWYSYLGRRDRQLKVNGYRIEPASVERALLTDPTVAQAVVVSHRRPSSGPAGAPARLVGYLVPAPGATVDTRGLRDRVAAALPAYAVPSVLTVVDELPRNRSGKLDAAALPEPGDAPAAEPAEAHVAPATEPEKILLEVWESVLGRTPLGVTDGFFDVGGDSVLAIAVVAAAREHGLPLTARLLFDRRTIRDIAHHLDPADPTTRPVHTVQTGQSDRAAQSDQTDRDRDDQSDQTDRNQPDRADQTDQAGYRATDFPDAGLDDGQLADLLGSLGIDQEGADR